MMTESAMPDAGGLERPLGEIPFIRMPDRASLFRERAQRLRMLAPGHAIEEFLRFMAGVCDAQQAALDAFPNVPLPSPEQIRLCREHGMPPLSFQGWRRSPAWREALAQILEKIKDNATPVSRKAIARLQLMDAAALEAMADAILAGEYGATDLAAGPFVAAALQVYWVHMATALGPSAFGRSETANLCPACASAPVASMVRIGGAEQGLRYLSCSLCGTQWHMVRIKCSNCESTKGIGYYAVEGTSDAVKAESCDSCGAYLKIAYMDKDPYVDPVADDLSTLTLDLLMDAAGKSRTGPNLFMMTAAAE